MYPLESLNLYMWLALVAPSLLVLHSTGFKGDTGIEMKTYKKVYIGAFISVCTGCSEGLFLIQGAMRKWGKE